MLGRTGRSSLEKFMEVNAGNCLVILKKRSHSSLATNKKSPTESFSILGMRL